MQQTAVFPGSFDPFTLGHENIVRRALPLFDEIIIAIGQNANKNYYFALDKRMGWIKLLFKEEPKIRVELYSGLTVDFCKQQKAAFIVRGLRNLSDFEFERSIAQMNAALNKNVETVFIMTASELASISSTIVRDIVRNGGDARQFVPQVIDLGYP